MCIHMRSEMQSSVRNFMDATQYMAQQHLPKTQMSSPSIATSLLDQRYISYPINIQYTDNSWNWGGWWRTQPTIVIQQPVAPQPKKTEEEKKEETANQMKWVGTGIALIGTAILAHTAKRLSCAYQAARNTRAIEQEVMKISCYNQDSCAIQLTLLDVVRCRKEIDQEDLAKLRAYTLSILGIVAGGTAMLIGGFMVSIPLATTGQILCIISVAGLIFASIWYWSDSENVIQGCREIQRSIPTLLILMDENNLPPSYQAATGCHRTFAQVVAEGKPPSWSDSPSTAPQTKE